MPLGAGGDGPVARPREPTRDIVQQVLGEDRPQRLVPLDDGTVVRFSVQDGPGDGPTVVPEGTRYIDSDGAVATWGAA